MESDPNEIPMNVETLSKFAHLGVKAPLKKDDCAAIIEELEKKRVKYDEDGKKELETEDDLYFDQRRGEFRQNRKNRDDEDEDEQQDDRPRRGDKKTRGGGNKKNLQYQEDNQAWPEMK